MSRHDYIKPVEYFVMEMLSKDYRNDLAAAGPFLSFYEAEQYRSKYLGMDNPNYYMRQGREENE